jgi:hypothetical protein
MQRCSGRRKESKAGSMKRSQIIAATTALMAALSAVAPGVVRANSLLNGYGGPGQGNQAILGSALLNGPGGGSGGGGGRGASTGEAKPGLAASSLAEATSGGARAGRRNAAHSGLGSGTGGKGRTTGGAATGGGGKAGGSGQTGKASVGAADAYLASEHGEARAASDGLETLGLSARDLLYLLFTLCLLVSTGMATRRLTGLTTTKRHG